MSLFDFLKKRQVFTVNEGINRSREENGILLDVRRKEDFKKGHVAGAQNAPIDSLEHTAKTRLRELDQPIYIIGSYSDRPENAVKILRKLGYTNVYQSGYMEEHQGLLKKTK